MSSAERINSKKDLVLQVLAVRHFEWCALSRIEAAFEELGYGDPAPILQQLAKEGYLEHDGRQVMPLYRISEQGERIRCSGRFVRRAQIRQESRTARTLTVSALLLLFSIFALSYWWSQ